MPAPTNPFKSALSDGQTQIGCWMSSGEAQVAEVMGETGFDWLLIDGEHAPNDLRSLRDQLQALRGSESHPVVRLPIGEVWMVKQMLDAGAQSLLIPMIDTAEQAAEMASACRYPPQGIRGVGSAASRASRFSAITDYLQTANDQICLLVQAETATALDNLDEILSVDGVDGVFIGPADLAASMGHLGNANHPDVLAAIKGAIAKIAASDKAAGILATDLSQAGEYLKLGAQFVATGLDVVMLAKAARELSAASRALLD